MSGKPEIKTDIRSDWEDDVGKELTDSLESAVFYIEKAVSSVWTVMEDAEGTMKHKVTYSSMLSAIDQCRTGDVPQ